MNFRKENRTEEYWESKLSKKEYDILRRGATELPYTGKYNDHFENDQNDKNIVAFIAVLCLVYFVYFAYFVYFVIVLYL